VLAIGEPQRFWMEGRTRVALWIIALAILALLLAQGIYSLVL